MESEIGSVPPQTWMKEHCDPVGGAFKVRHITTYNPPPSLGLVLTTVMTYGPILRQNVVTFTQNRNLFASAQMARKFPLVRAGLYLRNLNGCLDQRMHARGLLRWSHVGVLVAPVGGHYFDEECAGEFDNLVSVVETIFVCILALSSATFTHLLQNAG
jgi:hypothetical protein